MKDDAVCIWLRDYVAMMRINLGAISGSKVEGLYESIVERILEVEKYLKETPVSAGAAQQEDLIYGPDIDRDLKITDRGRRKMIARGIIPAPDGYFGGKAFWRASRYAAFKADLLAGKLGKLRGVGKT